MFHAIRTRINATTVLAVLALVFAMTGGAYAAKKYLITSTKQISPSVLKALQGKGGSAGVAGAPGIAGAQGAQGPAGPAGPAGSAGAKGETGPAGAKGIAGATGAKGVTGTTGATGETGFTEKLPKGKTETGTWAVSGRNVPDETLDVVPISFPIPLAAPGSAVFLNQEQTEIGAKTGGCSGTVAVPTAPAGTLCIYTSEEAREGFGAPEIRFNGIEEEYEPTGTLMYLFHNTGESRLYMIGSWAVTAP